MNWWSRLFRRAQMDAQLAKELRAHIEQHTEELIARGIDPVEARRRARLELGGPEQVAEDCRDARGTRWLEDLVQDFRYALRSLGKNKAFTAVILLTLALGIGATTLMFTLTSSVLLKPLAYPHPEKLLSVHGHTDDWNAALFGEQNVAYPDFVDQQRESRTMDLAAFLYGAGGTLTASGESEFVDRRDVSANLFAVLGAAPWQGRFFLPEEDRASGAPAIVLGYSLWQRRFGGHAEVVGTQIVLDENPYAIVGVAPQNFRLDGEEPDVFIPLGQNKADFLKLRRSHPINVLARLRPGANLAQAQAELAAMGGGLAQQYAATNAGRSFVVRPLRPAVGDVQSTLWLLLGAVSLVLLIACANIASLLLARAVAREREFGLRIALGAGRGRLVRQCLTESLVLGICGGALGIWLAAAGLRPFVAMWPGGLPRAEEVHLDWRALIFAVAISLLCGLVFGLAPALRAPLHHVSETLRAGARNVVGNSRKLHGVFVAAEIALTVVLLVAAGMLGRTLLRVATLDPGMNIHNVLITRMALSPSALEDADRTRAAWKDVLEHARAVPGIQAVAMVDTVPMREGNNQVNYATSADIPPENRLPVALATCVTPDYLRVMGIPLRAGRFFNEQDRKGNDPVIVIDDVLARQAFGGEDPVGKQLWLPVMGSPFSVWTQGARGADVARVIGVVGHVRHWGLAADDQAAVRAQFYYPFAQVPDLLVHRWSDLMSIAVRTNVAPLGVVQGLRGAVRGAAGDQVLYEVRTMEQLSRETLALQRFLLLLFGIFAGLALLLACVGIYGVLAYLVSRRVPEIGVRMALGAAAHDVMRMILRESLGMIFAGVVLGGVASVVAGRVLAKFVAGVRAAEPLTFALMIAVLVAAGLVASFVPAYRASRVDPVVALRQE
ncbi:MAG TPA: ABC transporter permease [Candidatus Acidoferrales bacterium]